MIMMEIWTRDGREPTKMISKNWRYLEPEKPSSNHFGKAEKNEFENEKMVFSASCLSLVYSYRVK
jgi:hypothetical protein